MKKGQDYLFAMMYEKQMLEGHTRGDVGGIFYNTPKKGGGKKTLTAMCKSGKFSEIVVQTAPFDYDHKYPINKYLPGVERDAKEIEAISKRYPNTVILISPFCEHQHPARVMAPVFGKLRMIAPSCLMLNSIYGKGEVVDGVITDIHLEDAGFRAKPRGEYTVSFDGFGGKGKGDFPDADIPTIMQRYPDARHIRGWNFRYNGKFGHNDPDSATNRKHFPSVRYIRGTAATMKVREGSVTWGKNILYKSFADDHGLPEPTKDNRAMFIIPTKSGQYIDILDINNNLIERIAHNPKLPPHTGDPKGNRYYSKFYAYELGNKAQAKTGSRQIKVRYGRIVTPTTDADLRSSKFKGK